MNLARTFTKGVAYAALANLLIMVALVGGPRDFLDLLEASTQPSLPRFDTEALAGKNVVITGANRGFGLGAAEHFLRSGANVVLACRRNPRAAMAELLARTSYPRSSLFS